MCVIDFCLALLGVESYRALGKSGLTEHVLRLETLELFEITAAALSSFATTWGFSYDLSICIFLSLSTKLTKLT